MATRGGPFTRRQIGNEIRRAEKAIRHVKSWEKKWVDLGHIKVYRWEQTNEPPKAVSLGLQRSFIKAAPHPPPPPPVVTEGSQPAPMDLDKPQQTESGELGTKNSTRPAPVVSVTHADSETSGAVSVDAPSAEPSPAPTPRPGSPPSRSPTPAMVEGTFSPIVPESPSPTPSQNAVKDTAGGEGSVQLGTTQTYAIPPETNQVSEPPATTDSAGDVDMVPAPEVKKNTENTGVKENMENTEKGITENAEVKKPPANSQPAPDAPTAPNDNYASLPADNATQADMQTDTHADTTETHTDTQGDMHTDMRTEKQVATDTAQAEGIGGDDGNKEAQAHTEAGVEAGTQQEGEKRDA